MDSTEKYLTFEVADGLYALPIYTVREIISDGSDVTTMPGFPQCAKGIIHIRGDVVPIIDLRCRFSAPEGRTDCVIVTDCSISETEYIGLAADKVCSVEDFEVAQIRKPPSFIKGAEFVSGIYKNRDRIALILSPELLVTDDMKQAMSR